MNIKRFNKLVGYPEGQPLRLFTFGWGYIKIPTIHIGRPIKIFMNKRRKDLIKNNIKKIFGKKE